MPIYIPERDIKVRCPKCGKEVTLKIGGYGDLIRNMRDILRFARDLNKRCPKCGADIKTMDNINPIED